MKGGNGSRRPEFRVRKIFSLFVIRYSLFILKKFPIFSTKTAKNPLVPLDDFSISIYYMTFNKEFFLES